jgi:hypothetical protein
MSLHVCVCVRVCACTHMHICVTLLHVLSFCSYQLKPIVKLPARTPSLVDPLGLTSGMAEYMISLLFGLGFK